jgi:lysophospholipase L1-like esterase
MSTHVISLLCLGDSYTIGEGLPLYESFPYQLMQTLRRQHVHVHAPEIVAKTGWTSFELADYLIKYVLQEKYDFVTLLIGVNNQYRGLEVADYAEEFEFLLKKAIHLAAGKPEHVLVLSIPDWTVTPFAAKEGRQAEAVIIDQYNDANRLLSAKFGTAYIDITADSRQAANDLSLLAADELHPSAKAYARWAAEAAAWVKSCL